MSLNCHELCVPWTCFNVLTFQEEEALLNEMEVTGQAFEDMQEQNSRLIQQLREKDDANFKLMTERIKSNQLHKLSREEKEVLKEQVRRCEVRKPRLKLRPLLITSSLFAGCDAHNAS